MTVVKSIGLFGNALKAALEDVDVGHNINQVIGLKSCLFRYHKNIIVETVRHVYSVTLVGDVGVVGTHPAWVQLVLV